MIAKKNQFIKLAGAVLACAVISACSSDDSGSSLNKGKASSGDADFSKFVSIGDSLTAGYADGALYLLGQTNSYPATLANQFADADDVAVAFEQPLVGDNQGGLLALGATIDHPVTGANLFENRFVLNTNPDPDVEGESPSPERLAGDATEEVIGTGLNGMAFNNLGVPGAKSFHIGAPNFGDPGGIAAFTANPFFVRFATSTTTSVIADAAAQQPSFMVLWIGNNDVLSFATSGGHNDFAAPPGLNALDQTGNTNPALYGPNDISDPGLFDTTYNGLIAAVKGVNPDVQGVLVNIPDIKTIPFFTTVPFNAVPLDQATADQLNAGYQAYNDGLQAALGLALIDADEAARRTITFAEGQNAVVIDTIFEGDEDLTELLLTAVPLPSWRQATAEDLILLSAGAIIGTEETEGDPTTVWGLGEPLRDQHVLVPSEIEDVDTARAAYNVSIKAAADADANLVHLDAAAIMVELQESGIDFGTGSISSTFATGGAFSLDGVHPTGRGYAVIANEIIDVINTGFNANVHKVDPALFPTIFLK